jgi:hypothetical protein
VTGRRSYRTGRSLAFESRVAFLVACAGISLLPVVFSTPGHPQGKEWQRKGNFNTPRVPSAKKKPPSPARKILPQAGPARCEWVETQVSGYAFENVKVRSCEGSAYIFEATREGKAFTIYMSIDTGELLKVEKFQSGGAKQTNGLLPQQPH